MMRKRRIKALIMLLVFIETILIGMYNNTVYAHGSNDNNHGDNLAMLEETFDLHESNKFYEDKNDYEFISKKIQDEKKNYTGVIDREKENKLNDCGILDEEIEALNDEDICMIQSTPSDELIIMTSIYACEDGEDVVSEMIELSSNQIDKLYAQQYYGKDTDLENELQKHYENIEKDSEDEYLRASVESVDRGTSKCSMIEVEDSSLSIRDNIDIMRGTTTALSSTTSSYFETNQSSYLKKTLYARIDKAKNTVSVTFSTVWIKMPENRNMDIIWIDWSGLYYTEGNACTVTHKVKEEYGTYSGRIEDGASLPIKTIKTRLITTECKRASKNKDLYGLYTGPSNVSIAIDSETYDIGPNGICIFTSMHNTVRFEDYSYNALYVDGEVYHYKDETIVVNVLLNINTGMNSQVIGCVYYHYYYIKEKEYDYSAITSAVISIGSKCVNFTRIGFAFGVIQAINKLATSNIVNVTTKLICNESGEGFRSTLIFRYK